MRLLTGKAIDNRQAKAEAYNEFSADFNIKFGPLITAAHEQWMEAYDLLTDTYPEHYRRTVKKTANQVCDRWALYWQRVRQAFAEKHALYIDFCQRCYSEQLELDCTKLYLAILRVIRRLHFHPSAPPADLIARTVTAKELTRVTERFYSIYWKEVVQRTGYADVGRLFAYADPSPMCSKMQELCDLISASAVTERVNLADDRDCNNGFLAIINRAQNLDWLDERGIEAMRLNTDGHDEMAQAIAAHDRVKQQEQKQQEQEERRPEQPKPLDLSPLAEKFKVSFLNHKH